MQGEVRRNIRYVRYPEGLDPVLGVQRLSGSNAPDSTP